MCQINQILETSSAKIFDFVHIFPEDRQKIIVMRDKILNAMYENLLSNPPFCTILPEI